MLALRRAALGVALVSLVMLNLFSAAQAAQVDICFGLPESRLNSGVLARVVGNSRLKEAAPPGAYLKSNAARSGLVLRYLPEGTILRIMPDSQAQCTVDGDRWWAVEADGLRGFVTESVGQEYVLEPYTGVPPTPAPSDLTAVLTCVRPYLDPPPPTPTAAPDSAPYFRAVFGSDDGTLQYADQGGFPRPIARFDYPPLSVDLSPDGTAALVLTYNGVYWVEILTGKIAYFADPTRFSLSEDMWFVRAQWTPQGDSAAVELVDTTDNIYTFPVWNISLTGQGAPFQVDTGKEPPFSVRRSPDRSLMIVLSANDILPYPKNFIDEPPPLLEFVPSGAEGDGRSIVPASITWSPDSSGFYAYTPKSEDAPPDDPFGGRLFFVPRNGTPQDFGALQGIPRNAEVIPAPNGLALLVKAGETWRIQTRDGAIKQKLPSDSAIFGWTPDSAGVAFRAADGKAGFIGTEGETESPYVPMVDNLFTLSWLPDGTALYTVRGFDGKLTLNAQPLGAQPFYIGIVAGEFAFSAATFNAAPGLARPPRPCE
jgi:hypothetical protein